MRLADSWARLVRKRWSEPARAKAREMRSQAQFLVGPNATVMAIQCTDPSRCDDAQQAARLLREGAETLERLAEVLDDITEPEPS